MSARPKTTALRFALALLVWATALAAGGTAQARRETAAGPLAGVRSVEAARRIVLEGGTGWKEYLGWLRGFRHSVFDRRELQANAHKQKFTLVEREQAFAMLRDIKAKKSVEQHRNIGREHLLGIPTWGRVQPTWLSSIADKDAALLGCLVRRTLDRPRQTHQLTRETYGYFHMPGCLSQPITHFHSKWRPIRQPHVENWDAFLARNYRSLGRARAAGELRYRLYTVAPEAEALARRWPLVAVADSAAGRPATMSVRTDRLLGRMFLGVARAALKLASPDLMTNGELQIDRADSRLVVRVAAIR